MDMYLVHLAILGLLALAYTRTGTNIVADPCPIEDGCVKLPDSSQLLDLGLFESQMLGRLYSSVYYIEGPRLRDTYHRLELKYVKREDGNVYEHYKFRYKGKAYCNMSMGINLKHPINNQTIFNLDQYIGLEFGWQHSRWFFVSDDPTKYALIMICTDRKTLTDTACNGKFTIAIMVTQDPPDSVSWYTIELKLREAFGLQMDDHRNHFLYIGDRCPQNI